MGFCLDSNRLTRELVAPMTASSVERDTVTGVWTPLSMGFRKGDGRREVNVELRELCVLAGVDLAVACNAAANDGDFSREPAAFSPLPDRRGVTDASAF